MDWLLFTLAGPRASFGTEASVGGERDALSVPSRSALLGLVAAAHGIRRSDAIALETLAEGLMFASRVNRAGSRELDYHTAQVAKRKDLRKRVVRTRFDELDVPRSELTTVLSSRAYRCDYHATVAAAFASDRNDRSGTLQSIAGALESPKWMLYLGRKSAPLAWPMSASVVSASTLQEAFTKYDALTQELHSRWPKGGRPDWMVSPVRRDLSSSRRTRLSAHFSADIGLQEFLSPKPEFTRVVDRRDVPRDRQRWQFSVRPDLQWNEVREVNHE